MSTLLPAAPTPTQLASPAPTPRLLMTRAEFEAAAENPETRVEWLGVTGETRDGDPLGLVWPRFGFRDDGSYAMPTLRHATINMNVVLTLGGQFDREAWDFFTQDAEVACGTGRTRLPDAVLAKRPAEYVPHPRGEAGERLLLSPAVCFEVTSRGTASVDRSEKPGDYLSISTVTDYLVIDQALRRVLHHRRAAGTGPPTWDVTTLDGPDDVVALAAPAVMLPLAEIYRGVRFD